MDWHVFIKYSTVFLAVTAFVFQTIGFSSVSWIIVYRTKLTDRMTTTGNQKGARNMAGQNNFPNKEMPTSDSGISPSKNDFQNDKIGGATDIEDLIQGSRNMTKLPLKRSKKDTNGIVPPQRPPITKKPYGDSKPKLPPKRPGTGSNSHVRPQRPTITKRPDQNDGVGKPKLPPKRPATHSNGNAPPQRPLINTRPDGVSKPELPPQRPETASNGNAPPQRPLINTRPDGASKPELPPQRPETASNGNVPPQRPPINKTSDSVSKPKPPHKKPETDSNGKVQLQVRPVTKTPAGNDDGSKPKLPPKRPKPGNSGIVPPHLRPLTKRPSDNNGASKPNLPPRRPTPDNNGIVPPHLRPFTKRPSDNDGTSKPKPPSKRPGTDSNGNVPPPLPPFTKRPDENDGVSKPNLTRPPRNPWARPFPIRPTRVPTNTTKRWPINKETKPKHVDDKNRPLPPILTLARTSNTDSKSGGKHVAEMLSKRTQRQSTALVISIGLWSAERCTRLNDEPNKCLKISVEKGLQRVQELSSKKDNEDLSLSTWTDLRAEVTLSLVVCLVGIVGTGLSVKPFCLSGRQRFTVAFGMCGLIISGVVYLIAASRVAVLNQALADDPQDLKMGVSVKTPWAVAIGFVGACTALVSAVFLGVVTWAEGRKKWKKFENEVLFTRPEGDAATPTAPDSVHISYQEKSTTDVTST